MSTDLPADQIIQSTPPLTDVRHRFCAVHVQGRSFGREGLSAIQHDSVSLTHDNGDDLSETMKRFEPLLECGFW